MAAYFATCAKGLEYLLRDELRALGMQAHEALAGVYFGESLSDAYRACLESRLASRVLMPLAEFAAADADALYAGVRAIDWSEHLDVDSSFAIDAVGASRELRHSKFAALKVKDAIVDQFRERNDARPAVKTERPDLRIHLRLHRDRATVSLDLSGEPLHRRGWREHKVLAPLKENLAAAILMRAQWPRIYADGGALVDPMCGSGTLLIEGALMAADAAPALQREYFGFLGWRGHDAALWQSLLDAARERADAGLRALRPVFFGSDVDPGALSIAKRNAQAAGVAGFVRLERHDVAHVAAPENTAHGLLVSNPPYGQRLGADEDLSALYGELGQAIRQRFSAWQAAIITDQAALGHALGLKARKRYTLYNGAIECQLLLFDSAIAHARQAPAPRPLSDGAHMLVNRLHKNLKRLRRQLERREITCFRIYDRDLPEYAAAIDVYQGVPADQPDGAPARHLHIQEYQAPASVPQATARHRMRELVRAAGEALEVPPEHIAVKLRRRGKGGARYGRMADETLRLEVREGGLRFMVELVGHIDTGLFLDHRDVRARVRELAQERRMLNLFAYTGTASVYAAAGGARATTSVDLSAPYLEWASDNLRRNGFQGRAHRLVQADALTFLEADTGRYELIYVDPPTFSNSKRAEDFDVQRDHVALLRACRARLADEGVIVFSNNYRRFSLDREALDPLFAIRDVTRASIPFDFARRTDIHACFELASR